MALCALLFSGFKNEGKQKRRTKEAITESSNRFGFRADWSKSQNILKRPLHFNPTGSQNCLFTRAVFFWSFAGLEASTGSSSPLDCTF